MRMLPGVSMVTESVIRRLTGVQAPTIHDLRRLAPPSEWPVSDCRAQTAWALARSLCLGDAGVDESKGPSLPARPLDAPVFLDVHSLLCPICSCFSGDSGHVCMPCGHVAHRACLAPWLKKDAHCPICKQAATVSTLEPVDALSIMLRYLDNPKESTLGAVEVPTSTAEHLSEHAPAVDLLRVFQPSVCQVRWGKVHKAWAFFVGECTAFTVASAMCETPWSSTVGLRGIDTVEMDVRMGSASPVCNIARVTTTGIVEAVSILPPTDRALSPGHEVFVMTGDQIVKGKVAASHDVVLDAPSRSTLQLIGAPVVTVVGNVVEVCGVFTAGEVDYRHDSASPTNVVWWHQWAEVERSDLLIEYAQEDLPPIIWPGETYVKGLVSECPGNHGEEAAT